MNKNKRFWKSLDQYHEKPESTEKKKTEFLQGVTSKFDVNDMPELPRRKFLAALGASTAFISTACTDYRDKGEIITYNKKPENIEYGIANYYASTLNDGKSILIKTREGRPIKIDGNPDHPVYKGKTDTNGQSSVMDLYDPGRLKDPMAGKSTGRRKVSWKDADKQIIQKLNSHTKSGKEIAIITHAQKSPSAVKILDEFKKAYSSAKVYSYELTDDSNKRKAWEKAYGNGYLPKIKYDKAKVILSLESDFLHADEDAIESIRQFSSTRDVDKLDNFSRLYTVEAPLSVTGTNSDYRMRLSPEYQYEFVLTLLNEILVKRNGINIEVPGEVLDKIAPYSMDKFLSRHKLDKEVIEHLIDDLMNNNKKAVVTAGDSLPEETHSAVLLLNEVIGAAALYDRKNPKVLQRELSKSDDLKRLSQKMKKGQVGAVINFDTNPAYHFAPDLEYEKALKNVPDVVTFCEIENESCLSSNYILPQNHALESWGDFISRGGIIDLQQPVISPLYNTRQKEAVLLTWINKDPESYSYDIYHKFIKNRWKNDLYPKLTLGFGFDKFWYSALHDGFYEYDKNLFNGKDRGGLNYKVSSFTGTKSTKNKNKFTVILTGNPDLGDGRYANNGWLQEIPDTVTKVVWDNYGAVSPATASKMGVGYADNEADMIEVSAGGRKLKLPVLVQPGMADDTVAIKLGYGRTNAGEIGTDVGFDGIKLMTAGGDVSRWIYTGASVSKTGEKYQLVSTQEHHQLDDDFVKDFHRERKIIREGTVQGYKKNPDVIKDQYLMKPEKIDKEMVNPDRHEGDIKWAMSMDLNKCTGCNLCVAACNVENNIPVVGKEEASKGREMQWIRLDRYYSGDPDAPVTSYQPMTCQHCDNAPCENVCPVVATTHSPDGLNQMVYNRCVGTRYCANNCPYKVRRFNFFNFRDWYKDEYYESESFGAMHNPEVTVRSRGVMEKCTFCVQRIMEGRQEATKEGEEFTGKGITTACQDACPAEAIEFGNYLDPDTKIAEKREHKLEYKVLDHLGVKPNISYIGRLRNIHTEEILSE